MVSCLTVLRSSADSCVAQVPTPTVKGMGICRQTGLSREWARFLHCWQNREEISVQKSPATFLNFLHYEYKLVLSTVALFFHKNVEAEINQNFKSMLKTYPGWGSVKNVFILLICFCHGVNLRVQYFLWSQIHQEFVSVTSCLQHHRKPHKHMIRPQ